MSVITVTPYDPRWPSWFEALVAHLEPALSHLPHRIEHVGSTSVPGLSAKPIIDLDVILEEAHLGAAIAALEALGHTHRGELGIAGRHAFRPPGNAELPAHHLYVCIEGSEALRNHLTLRDHLRAHPEDVVRYGELKRRLAEQFPRDIDAYVEGKTELIVELLARHGMSSQALDAIRAANAMPPR